MLLRQLGRTLGAFKRAYEAELGISAPAAWTLSLLNRRDGLSQNDLTCITRADPSLVTRMLQDMEKNHGWVRRERDPADNRLMRVYLTEQGRERAYGLYEQMTAVERRLTRDLSTEQVDQLFAMLRTLEAAAREDCERRTRTTIDSAASQGNA